MEASLLAFYKKSQRVTIYRVFVVENTLGYFFAISF